MCSEVEAIRWVAENLEVADVSAADAPGPSAWALLCHCRQIPSAKADFWRTIWPKLIPSKALLEDPGLRMVNRTRGSGTRVLIDDLLGERRRSQPSLL